MATQVTTTNTNTDEVLRNRLNKFGGMENVISHIKNVTEKTEDEYVYQLEDKYYSDPTTFVEFAIENNSGKGTEDILEWCKETLNESIYVACCINNERYMQTYKDGEMWNRVSNFLYRSGIVQSTDAVRLFIIGMTESLQKTNQITIKDYSPSKEDSGEEDDSNTQRFEEDDEGSAAEEEDTKDSKNTKRPREDEEEEETEEPTKKPCRD